MLFTRSTECKDGVHFALHSAIKQIRTAVFSPPIDAGTAGCWLIQVKQDPASKVLTELQIQPALPVNAFLSKKKTKPSLLRLQ